MPRLKPLLLAISLLAAPTVFAAGDLSRIDYPATLAQAQKQQQPVLLEFHAPWCHSCYYMEKEVLTGAEWQRFQQQALVLPVDTDTPEGTALKERYAIIGVPSFVLVKPDGSELGRIVGDMPRAQFYGELAALQKNAGGLATLQAMAQEFSPLGDRSALQAVKILRRGYLGAAGMAWWNSLPAARRAVLETNPELVRELAWLRVMAAERAEPADAATCAALAPSLLTSADASQCSFAAEVSLLNSCTRSLPAPERAALFGATRPALEKLVREKVLAPQPQCSDNRDPVLLAKELAELSGEPAQGKAILDYAIAHSNAQLAKGVARNKSIADNQRVFLEAAGRTEELDQLLARLTKAYPDDYVYANRYARALAARGAHAKALAWFEKAATKAYGLNRLRNAQEQVKSLIALAKPNEAAAVAQAVLAEIGPWFAAEAAKLKALIPAR